MKSNSKIYRLCDNRKPLTCMIATKHSRSKELTWLDEEKKENRALRYATNQSSIFQDEQDSEARLGQIVFLDGAFTASDRQLTLQKFLAHHPDNVANGGRVFYEMDHEAEAQEAVRMMDIEFEAQELSRSLNSKQLKAILRKEVGAKVDQMYSGEIKLDARVLAKRNPLRFMELAESTTVETDDNIARFVEEKLLSLRKQDTEVWNSQDNDKTLLLRIPYGEDCMETLTEYFHDNKEGVAKYKELMKLLEAL